MSDEVGKVSLGLELDTGDLGKQVEAAAGNAGSRFSRAMRTAMGNVFKGFKGAAKVPPIDPPEIKPAKLNIDVDAVNADLEHLNAVLDNTNAKLGIQERKLAELREAYANTFNESKKNELHGKIVNTEAAILRLTASSDKTVKSIWKLEDSLKQAAEGAGQAEKPVEKLGQKVVQLNKPLKQAKGNLDKAGKAAAGAGKEMESAGQSAQRSGNSFTQAFGRILRQVFVFAVLYKAIRGFNSYMGGALSTNQQFMASLNAVQTNLRVAFQPIYEAILPALNALMSWLAKATAYIAAFISAIFGKTYQQSFAAAKGIETAKKAMEGYGKKAKKAGQEAKGALAGFDQLNTLDTSAPGADDDAGAAGAGADGFEMQMPDMDITGIQGKMDSLAASVKETFDKALAAINLEPLRKSLKGLAAALKPFGKMAGQGLHWFLKNVLVPLGKWTIEKALPAFLDVLAGALRVLDSVIKALMPAAAWLWDKLLRPLAAWTGGVIIGTLTGLADALNGLSNWINNNQGTFLTGALLVGSFFAAFKIAGFLVWVAPFLAGLGQLIASGGLLSAVLGALSSAFAALTSPIGVITALAGMLIFSFIDLYRESETFREAVQELGRTWQRALQPLADFVAGVLTDAWKQILQPAIQFFLKTLLPQLIDLFKQLWQKVLVPLGNFIGTVLKPVFQILADVLTMLWKNVIVPLAKAVGGVLAEAWNAFYSILSVTVLPIIGKVIDVVTQLWKRVLLPMVEALWASVKPAFDTVFDGIKTVIEGLQTTLTGLIRFITGVFTGDWRKAWEGVKMIFKGVFDSLYGIVKTPLNLIIDAINMVIDGLNDISFDMPGFLGGGKFGLSIPRVPALAKGGLVHGPTLAMVGDNKGAAVDPEVVSPLSMLQGMFDASNAAVVAVLGQILQALKSGDRDTVIMLGETELGRAAIKSINSVQRQAGRTLLDV